MGLLDIVQAPLREVLKSAEGEAEHSVPVHDLETRAVDAVEAIRDATEQIEAHVKVLETLATSMTPLTLAVEKLCTELAVVSEVLAPVAAAERDVGEAEHAVTRLGHLFGSHRQESDS